MKTGIVDVGGGFRGVYACGVNTLSRSRSAMQRLYEKGYADGHRIESFMSENISLSR